MNLYGISRLRCPNCQGELTCHAFAEEAADSVESFEGEADQRQRIIRDGVLTCAPCRVWYPIASYVPIMLIFKIPFHDHFRRKFDDRFADLAGLHPPQGLPEPGEASVQQTFTEEWDAVRDNELTFSYTKEDLRELHRQVWLQWGEDPPDNVRSILNVGCGGQGAEAEALCDISRADVFGIDLTPTLLHAAPSLRHKSRLHLIVASIFHCPFPRESFDLVYSQGVLHHTYSTYEAFRNCTEFVRVGGEICVWLYGLEDHLARKGWAGLVNRWKYYGEEYLYLRHVISRMPSALRAFCVNLLAVVSHPFFKLSKRHGQQWSLANTQHSIRDRLTPRYAHKHAFNEVIEWYENLGFTTQVHSPAAYRRLFSRPLWGVGIRGTRLER